MNNQESREQKSSTKKLLGLALVAASVTLAVVIGQRMSTDAMAVVIGVVFGVAASIPTSLLIVAATRSRHVEPHPPVSPPDYRPAPPPQAPQPQIYIVSPSGMQQAPWLSGGLPAQLPMPPVGYDAESARRFKVVGQEEHWLEAEPDQW